MEYVDRRNDQCQIVASSSLTEEHIEVLKQGDTFGLFDQYGDIHSQSCRIDSSFGLSCPPVL